MLTVNRVIRIIMKLKSFSNLIALIVLSVGLLSPIGPVGCSKTTLEAGSQYSLEGQKPDKAFYAADAAFELSYSLANTAFEFEQKNRQLLWSLSPDIKRTLDRIRPQAKEVAVAYAQARKAYTAYPTPAGLSTLETVLGRMQQIASAAQAALPKK